MRALGITLGFNTLTYIFPPTVGSTYTVVRFTQQVVGYGVLGAVWDIIMTGTILDRPILTESGDGTGEGGLGGSAQLKN